MEGWIKIHRKLNDTSFKTKPLVVALFIHLLTTANHKPNKFLWNNEEIIVKEGQLLTGRKELSKQTGISEQSIRTGLTCLKSTNTITIKSTSKFSLISISNWHTYQGQLTIKSTNELTNNQPATNQQLTTNKNDKNVKNDKNITNVMLKTDKRNPDINELIKYFLIRMSIPKEDCAQKESRRYWQLLLRESKTGIDGVKWLIELASKDDFYKNNITSSKDLYYKRVKLITRKRGNKPKIAVMGKEEYVETNDRHESLLAK